MRGRSSQLSRPLYILGAGRRRCFSDRQRLSSPPDPDHNGNNQLSRSKEQDKQTEQGAMTRRLSEMTEQSLEEGGKRARKAVEEASFSEELKRELEERIAGAQFRAENIKAFSELNMPSSAGKGTRHIAAAEPWTGTETKEDAVLRMLNDTHKPLRIGRASGKPNNANLPPIGDLRPSRIKQSSGARLVNARDRSSRYALSQDPTLSDKEREDMRKEFKARFKAEARAVPASIRGLESLANERIEDAIARGQFRNLPRGKVIERDYTASSPFLDTTEYFMNKIIQKQEIVPPWIEKQQALVKSAATFRARLRADWKRHAARMISSSGGSLHDQIRKAEDYAMAEARENPRRQKSNKTDALTNVGQVSHVVFTGTISEPDLSPATPFLAKTLEESGSDSGEDQSSRPRLPPFRDPVWERNEQSYHKTVIDDLNSQTRSYNLMAPDLAKKPYFSLERELRTCYADVAPQLAEEILERARKPSVKIEVIGHTPGGVMERFGGRRARIYDNKKPHYGFKELWRDLFAKT